MVDKWWTQIDKHAGLQAVLSCGAEGGIRTPTMLPPPAPQAEERDGTSQPTSVKRGRLSFRVADHGR